MPLGSLWGQYIEQFKHDIKDVQGHKDLFGGLLVTYQPIQDI